MWLPPQALFACQHASMPACQHARSMRGGRSFDATGANPIQKKFAPTRRSTPWSSRAFGGELKYQHASMPACQHASMPACQHASMPISEPRPMAPKLQGVLRTGGANLFGSGVASIALETGALQAAGTLLPQALFATPGTFCYPRHFSHASMPACQHASMPAGCVAARVLRRGRPPDKRSSPHPGGARPEASEPSGEN